MKHQMSSIPISNKIKILYVVRKLPQRSVLSFVFFLVSIISRGNIVKTKLQLQSTKLIKNSHKVNNENRAICSYHRKLLLHSFSLSLSLPLFLIFPLLFVLIKPYCDFNRNVKGTKIKGQATKSLFFIIMRKCHDY